MSVFCFIYLCRRQVFPLLCFALRWAVSHSGYTTLPFCTCGSLALAFTSSWAEDSPSVSLLSLRFLAIFWDGVEVSRGSGDVWIRGQPAGGEWHRCGDSLLTRYTGWPFTFASSRKHCTIHDSAPRSWTEANRHHLNSDMSLWFSSSHLIRGENVRADLFEARHRVVKVPLGSVTVMLYVTMHLL